MDQLPLFTSVSLSVTDVTRYLRTLLESDDVLRDVWVQGEISNLSRPSSGHVYFTLKDEGAALRSVIWKTNAVRMRLPLQNGTRVEAHGYISLYEREGQYQLYIDALRLAGEGLLYQEFLRLRARLEAEGLFDPERKRPVPPRPQRIGIVTSPTGAALQDMLNTLQRRYPLAEVLLAPTAVQGEEAPLQIVAALERLNRLAPDVILLARGGGSLEDLWAFNDERVVRAVAASAVPVITGIGHETDFTLADFAADLRAPTPTAAAMLAAPDAADLRAGLANLAARLIGAFGWRLQQHRRDLQDCAHRLERVSPAWRVSNDRQRLDMLSLALQRNVEHTLSLNHARAAALAQRLTALHPLAVLQRGFAIVTGPDGALVRSVNTARAGSTIQVRLFDGRLDAEVTRVLPAENNSGGSE